MAALKPLLATNVEDFSHLSFPAYVSPKLDGVRAMKQGGVLLSRSLKPIPNRNVQALFADLPEGFDGELIVGSPSDDPYRRTVSVVMSDDKPADDVLFYAFDIVGLPDHPFQKRYDILRSYIGVLPVVIIPQLLIGSLADLETAEATYLEQGYEGLMYRDPNGRYKNGRSSEREQILLKVKRFRDAEATITEAYEEMENQNASFTNELGRTARSSAKAGKIGKGQLGGFHVVGLGGNYNNIAFDVSSSSIEHTERKAIWESREVYIGRVVKYKYFPVGGDTRPRFPIFIGFRDKRDM